MASPNFKNRTLWTGDNLDIMRGMNSECVDLIYLDPPFNSNKNYAAPIGSEAAGAAFKDTWTLSDVDEAWHGEIAEKEPALYAVIDTAGLTHGRGMKAYLIMMAIRLLEMRRLLKPTGSIYLHCDPTASHYLKVLMDCLFGSHNYRNEITWKRKEGSNRAVGRVRKFGISTDSILFYAGSGGISVNPQFSWDAPGYREYVEKFYRHADADGRRYRLDNLAAPSLSPTLIYDYKGYSPPATGWRVSLEVMKRLDAQGRIHFPKDKNGRLSRKRYTDELKGKPVSNLWDDIPIAGGKERTGYPTQKPLALLERIIKASSNEGDMILDPFCGCATALVAADRLNREWGGVDLSPLAATLVLNRIREDRGPLFDDVIHRTDIPHRMDFSTPPAKSLKHRLYGRQEGVCIGCRIVFPYRNMTIDHILPRHKGGQDNIENLQLLCGACNSTKGTLTQEEFIARLKQRGIRE